jgi:hypothetical protein
MAYAGRDDFHQYLVSARRFNIDCLDDQWSAGVSGYRCLDSHNIPPTFASAYSLGLPG